jgi:hypothetical protein
MIAPTLYNIHDPFSEFCHQGFPNKRQATTTTPSFYFFFSSSSFAQAELGTHPSFIS